MHKLNAGYTVLARVRRDRVDDVARLLAEMDKDPDRLPFARMATTHFAMATVMPLQQYGDEELPPTLLLATSYCGPTREHLDELVRVVGRPLRELLQHCERFDPACSDEDLEEFLRKHRHGDTFYSGMQHQSPLDVKRHIELREAIEAFIDERHANGGFGSSDPCEVRRQIQAHIRAAEGFEWTAESFAVSRRTWLLFHLRSFLVLGIAIGIVALLVALYALVPVLRTPMWVTLGIGAGFAAWAVLALRDGEDAQQYISPRQPDDHVRSLCATQNRLVINEMTLCGPIKEEGLSRPLVLRVALWVVGRIVEGIPYIPYFKGGVHIPTVATARWIAADRGRRLVFISNFTNTAESYVRDFIDIDRAGAMRINLAFGFGRGYPKTRWIAWGGALENPNAFDYVVTENQKPTAFWYGPYCDISIDNIRINRRIREGLFADYDHHQAQDWLHLL